MSPVQDYLSTVTTDEKAVFENILEIARSIVPDAEEGLSYGMPALKYKGRPLIGFISSKEHLSIFPFSPKVVDAVAGKLEGYQLSKGTIRFSLSKPVPDEVIRDIVNLRLSELA